MTNEEKAKEIANDFYIHGARTYLARVEAAQRMAEWKDEQIKIEKQAAIDKNELLVIRCIMALNKYDLRSAVKFAENVPDLYELAMAVAQAKDEEKFKAEEQQWIDKACEWLEENASKHIHGPAYIFYKESMIEEFQQAMKGE